MDTSGASAWPLRSYLDLEATGRTPRAARRHARQVLTEWGLADLTDDAELVISELVTNAVRATAALSASQVGHPPVRLWLCSDKDRLLIQVWDASDQVPVKPDHVPAEALSGRGLLLVSALCLDTGVSRWHPAAGKAVWAIVGLPRPRTERRSGSGELAAVLTDSFGS
jgi:anti-sigma regulatory factor (Ser/Thr protein kinase)